MIIYRLIIYIDYISVIISRSTSLRSVFSMMPCLCPGRLLNSLCVMREFGKIVHCFLLMLLQEWLLGSCVWNVKLGIILKHNLKVENEQCPSPSIYAECCIEIQSRRRNLFLVLKSRCCHVKALSQNKVSLGRCVFNVLSFLL